MNPEIAAAETAAAAAAALISFFFPISVSPEESSVEGLLGTRLGSGSPLGPQLC